jgi:hypothetical protein
LKKRTKKFYPLELEQRPVQPRAKHPGEVFWFFFSKKNILPSAALHQFRLRPASD